MPTTPLFPDVTRVTKKEKVSLFNNGLVNADRTVVSWMRLAPWLIERKLPKYSAKLLVLIELERNEPRWDILHRLVCYLSNTDKEQTLEAIRKLL